MYDELVELLRMRAALIDSDLESWEQIKEFPKAWNTRQTPPIGRCWECNYQLL